MKKITTTLIATIAIVILSGCGTTTRNIPMQEIRTQNEQGEIISSQKFVMGQEVQDGDPGSEMIQAGVNMMFAEKGFSLLPSFWSPSDDEYAYAQVWNGSLINWHKSQEITIYNPEDNSPLVTFNPIPFPWHALYHPRSSAERLNLTGGTFLMGVGMGMGYDLAKDSQKNNNAITQSAINNVGTGFDAGANATLNGVNAGAALVGP